MQNSIFSARRQSTNRVHRWLIILIASCSGAISVAQDSSVAQADESVPGFSTGRVVNVINVPGYTYLEIQTSDDVSWLAVPSATVKAGDSVSFSTRVPMRNFFSNSLNREFDVIYFVDRVHADDRQSPRPEVAMNAHSQANQQTRVVRPDQISRPEGGHSIADILELGAELDGKQVRVRGQVMKFTPGVLNANWIRIQDGSTEEELVAMTDAVVAVDDVVLIDGRLSLNKNLGQGYVMPAVLENSVVIIE